MDKYEQIEQRMLDYLEASYQKDYDQLIPMFYADDLIECKNRMTDFLKQLQPFGEDLAFLRLLSIEDYKEFIKLTPEDLLIKILERTSEDFEEGEMEEMMKNTVITNIDHSEFMTTVNYYIPFEFLGEEERIEGYADWIWSNNEWKVCLRQELLDKGMKTILNEIDLFKAREKKDTVKEGQNDDYLTPYTIVGYKNMEGEIVIEPRFSEASYFSYGLAPIKVFELWGYINQTGKIVITPAYISAGAFSEEGIASVELYDEESKPDEFGYSTYWTFINRKGEMITEHRFKEVDYFSEGLAAVRKEDTWGYLNTEGKIVIPFQFYSANSFFEGTALVEFEKEDGSIINFEINNKGEWID